MPPCESLNSHQQEFGGSSVQQDKLDSEGKSKILHLFDDKEKSRLSTWAIRSETGMGKTRAVKLLGSLVADGKLRLVPGEQNGKDVDYFTRS